MNRTLGVLFYLKSAKKNTETGKTPIYLRITVDGLRTEFSIKRDIDATRWSSEGGKAKGTNEESRELNAYIDTIKAQVLAHQKKLIDDNKRVTAIAIKNSMLGLDEKGKSLIDLMKYHNKQMKALIGKGYALGTSKRYETSLAHIQAYIQWKYKANDLPVKDVDHQFIVDYEFYLKSEKSIANNTAVKYIRNFKKIIRIALASGWISKDPFVNFKARLREVERHALTTEEINCMIVKEFDMERLSFVKDIFIFCCYTGLAYTDVQKLTKNNIVIGIDGEQWINVNRTKTDVLSKIPLLQQAKDIISKYRDNPRCLASNKLLPVLSNQKMNAYLKEIADLCGITKTLTMHIARHTFATTITLSNNVPIESVSKMLGHTNLATTQHYAKVLDKKLSEDMTRLKGRLAKGN